MIARAPGFSTVTVLILALGIGASTAFFGAFKVFLLDTVPGPRPSHRFVRLRYAGENEMARSTSEYVTRPTPRAGRGGHLVLVAALPRPPRRESHLGDLAASAPMSTVSFAVAGEAEIADGLLASWELLRVLGVEAALGRTIGAADDDPPPRRPSAFSAIASGSGASAVTKRFSALRRR